MAEGDIEADLYQVGLVVFVNQCHLIGGNEAASNGSSCGPVPLLSLCLEAH